MAATCQWGEHPIYKPSGLSDKQFSSVAVASSVDILCPASLASAAGLSTVNLHDHAQAARPCAFIQVEDGNRQSAGDAGKRVTIGFRL
jgi:hypothetical protein